MDDRIEGHVVDVLCAYVLGCLDDEEMSRVHAHLTGCAVCRQELAAYQATVDTLALATPHMAPPPDLKRRLLSLIRASSPRVEPLDPDPPRVLPRPKGL